MSNDETSKRPASLRDFLHSQQPTVTVKRIDMFPKEQAPIMDTNQNSGLAHPARPQSSNPQTDYTSKDAVQISNKNEVEPLRSQSVEMDPQKLNPGLAFSPAAITNQNKLQVKSDAQSKAD